MKIGHPQIQTTASELKGRVLSEAQNSPALVESAHDQLKGVSAGGRFSSGYVGRLEPRPRESVALRIIGSVLVPNVQGRLHRKFEQGLFEQSFANTRSDDTLDRAIRKATGLSEEALREVVEDVTAQVVGEPRSREGWGK